ncbi:hypothetical protein SNE25_25150 [Mucilaginibacter sabulilitoris]|uniref:Uncharacterized protein n=1 Tax=Mucilaginibacter sabulilitoris TaxID=1173583 RepID=A0ABZ0TIY3_9SPHI|nr:hypothetical protein [Mucilaginibacter sabulilitoris]WPU92616.1 hypothetical protein SNE25_25150 [Mucilaginibacter sabulilitoris]
MTSQLQANGIVTPTRKGFYKAVCEKLEDDEQANQVNEWGDITLL